VQPGSKAEFLKLNRGFFSPYDDQNSSIYSVV
jgi:hypothetical protein